MECAFAVVENVEVAVDRASSSGSEEACSDAVEEFMMLIRLASGELVSEPDRREALPVQFEHPSDEELLKLTHMFDEETSEVSHLPATSKARLRGGIRKLGKGSRKAGAMRSGLAHVSSEISIGS
mmetsp:Transcript_3507/g.9639  ORF Transcript_3507/g.9639 Transcript_3507/m.9639 type:complete len:125 (-) Transcript_3507:59-433(-)